MTCMTISEHHPNLHGVFQFLSRIQELRVTHLPYSPPFEQHVWSNFTMLKRLVLVDVNVRRLPANARQRLWLQQITHLRLSRVTGMEVTNELLTALPKLQSLDMQEMATSLTDAAITDAHSHLSNLVHLRLRGCYTLRLSTGAVALLTRLRSLHVHACMVLAADAVMNMPDLLSLSLDSLLHLHRLFHADSRCTRLTTLALRHTCPTGAHRATSATRCDWTRLPHLHTLQVCHMLSHPPVQVRNVTIHTCILSTLPPAPISLVQPSITQVCIPANYHAKLPPGLMVLRITEPLRHTSHACLCVTDLPPTICELYIPPQIQLIVNSTSAPPPLSQLTTLECPNNFWIGSGVQVLTSLTRLNVAFCPRMTAFNLQHLPLLRVVHLGGWQRSQQPAHVLHTFGHQLTHVQLDHTSVTNITPNALRALQNVRCLWLRNHPVAHVVCAMRNLRTLEALDASNDTDVTHTCLTPRIMAQHSSRLFHLRTRATPAQVAAFRGQRIDMCPIRGAW